MQWAVLIWHSLRLLCTHKQQCLFHELCHLSAQRHKQLLHGFGRSPEARSDVSRHVSLCATGTSLSTHPRLVECQATPCHAIPTGLQVGDLAPCQGASDCSSTSAAWQIWLIFDWLSPLQVACQQSMVSNCITRLSLHPLSYTAWSITKLYKARMCHQQFMALTPYQGNTVTCLYLHGVTDSFQQPSSG